MEKDSHAIEKEIDQKEGENLISVDGKLTVQIEELVEMINSTISILQWDDQKDKTEFLKK